MTGAWPTHLATRQVTELAARHGLTVRWTESPPHAHVDHKTVDIPSPTSATRYLDCLHEVGHCASGQAAKFYRRWDRRRPHWTPTAFDDGFLMEAAAWAWAAKHIDDELYDLIPSRAWKIAGGALVSYLPWVRSEKFDCVRREPRSSSTQGGTK